MNIVDFHSHVLPGIDDGSKSVEQSLAMLRREVEQGINHVVATPHFYAAHDNPQHFLNARQTAECRLREAMASQEGMPELTVGAEVHYFPGMSDSEILPAMTIGKTPFILVEMPHGQWTDRMYRELSGIFDKQGLTPIIAHIDRYITAFRSFGIPQALAEQPVLVQANAEFFTDGFTRRKALAMLRRGDIHLLGSDCHNLSDRAPNLGEAVKLISKRLSREIIERIENCQNEVLGSTS